MGTVNRAGRLALVSILAGASVAACGTAAPTSNFQTKQLVPLGGYGWAEAATALNSAVAATVSEVQPITTNIVGTSPWLGFPSPIALGAAPASPWPTFAGNIGTASVMNAQLGYIMGTGPLGIAPSAFSLVGGSILGLASLAGLVGYAGLPFVGPWGNLGAGGYGIGAGYGGGAVVGSPMMGAMPGGVAQQPAQQQPAEQQQPAQQQAGQQQQPAQQQAAQPQGMTAAQGASSQNLQMGQR